MASTDQDVVKLLEDHVQVVTSAPNTHLSVRVESASWLEAASTLRHKGGFGYFSFLSAIDWLPNPDLDGESVFDSSKEPAGPQEVIVDEAIRVCGGTSRFQLIAQVQNVVDHVGVTLITDVPDDLVVDSWTSVYRGADWHERETWEMFGISFSGHPGLRHIYLPEEFEGHPLRKDFPLLARVVRPWPGLVDMEDMPTVPAAEQDSP